MKRIPQVMPAALALALLLSLGAPTGVRADDIIHTVQPGENLFRIGLTYGVSWQDIAAANGLLTTKIYVGQQLRIPAAGDTAAAPVAPAATPLPPVEAPPVSPPADNPSTYTVQRGDTLGSIAARFGLPQTALAAANQISDPHWIYAGQVLIIPGGTAAPVEAAPTCGRTS